MPIIDKKNYTRNGSFTYSTDSDQTHHQGFVINHIDGMKTSTNYMVSFKVRVVSGSVNSIGVLKRINHTNGEVFLDNVKLSGFDVHTTIIPPSSSVADTTINNGEFHEVVIKFTTSEYPVLLIDSDITTKGDAFFFNYDQAVECIAEIKDLKWEIQGNSPTTWTRAPEDLVTPYELIDSYTKIETDELLDCKANVEDVYQKTETYNKSEIEKMIDDVTGNIGGGSGGSIDAYTKSETDDLLSKKVDIESVYLKADTDNLLKSYLPITGGNINGNLKVTDENNNEILKVQGDKAYYNNHLIASEVYVDDRLSRSLDTNLKQIGFSVQNRVFYGGSNVDKMNSRVALNKAIQERANSKYYITNEQLNGDLFDTGTYFCNDTLIGIMAKVITSDKTMIVIHTSRHATNDSIFYSEQTAYGIGDSNQGRMFRRFVRYTWRSSNFDYTISASPDWTEIPMITISLDEKINEFFSSKYTGVQLNFYNNFTSAAAPGVTICTSSKGTTIFNSVFRFGNSYSAGNTSDLLICCINEAKFRPQLAIMFTDVNIYDLSLTGDSRYIGHCGIRIDTAGNVKIVGGTLTCNVRNGIQIRMGGLSFPNCLQLTDF